MAAPVSAIYQVVMNWRVGTTEKSLDCTKYVSNVSVNHEIQTLSPTFSITFSENLYKYELATPDDRSPIDGSEKFSIYMGYGSTLVPMLINGTVSTFTRTVTKNGVEFIVNGRGPMAKLIDEGPEFDQIYIPTWDKSYSKEGYWVNSACGAQRTEPVPPGVDPNQDVDEYEIFEGDWYVHTILRDIINNMDDQITLVLNIPDAKYREVFRFNRTQTWISAIQQLVSVWEPLLFMRSNYPSPGNTLYILDTDMALPESSNITYGPSSCSVTNFNYTKNSIINRVIIKGGADETVDPPDLTEHWVSNIDYTYQVLGEDLAGLAQEVTISEHAVPGGTGGFTGSRVKNGYYQPMFGGKLHVYTTTLNYYKDRIMKIKHEVNYYSNTGTWGADQQVCTRVFKKRVQEFVVNGYYTSDTTPQWVNTSSIYIEQGFSGNASTGTDAADPNGQPILPVYFGWETGYIKVLDSEEIYDAQVDSVSSAAISRTFGIMPKGNVMSVTSPDTPLPGSYYLIGGAPVINPKDLWLCQKVNGFKLSYRIINEKIVITNTSSSEIAVKQTNIFNYTKMISDYDTPEIETMTETIPLNRSLTFTNTKKPVYQYEKYYEDLPSIQENGYKAVVTYYDPSIINDGQSLTLWNKIKAKSGRVEQELVIKPTIGNPLLSIGKSLVLESSTYKQVNFELWEYTKNTTKQLYQDAVVSGGNFIVNGIRHSFNKNDGFQTEVSLRKLWALIT